MYSRPKTLDAALHVLAQDGGQILSGGTDFFPALGDRPVPEQVIDISGLREIKGITVEADYVRIGGLTTWSHLVATPLPRCFDGLKSAAREIGGIQIQNRGTVAGNLCNASPAADSVPPLLTLDAEVELVSKSGIRRLALADFIVGNRKTVRRPDEILANVFVPRTLDDARSTFLKLGSRRYLVISIAMRSGRARRPHADLPPSSMLWSASRRAPDWAQLRRRNIWRSSRRSMMFARLQVTAAMPH